MGANWLKVPSVWFDKSEQMGQFNIVGIGLQTGSKSPQFGS
jgi:hypothetical protein